MKEEVKIVKEYRTGALGFPIIIHNVRLRKTGAEWYPEIKWNKLMHAALIGLMTKPSALTGNELRFIRNYFDLSYRAFAMKFGVTGPGVKKWEGKVNSKTDMQLGTERNIRLYILHELFPTHVKTKAEFIDMVNYIIEHHFNEKRKPLEFKDNDLAA